MEEYREAGGDGPCYAQVTLCWAESEDDAKRTAHRIWPIAGLGGDLNQELPLPRHFEQAAESVSPDDVAEAIPCGPDVDRIVAEAREYADAGFDHLYFHQIGPDQEGFLRVFRDEIAPRLRD